MKKVLFLSLALIIALTGLATGYAMWSKALTINGTVATGTVNGNLTVGQAWDEGDEAKENISDITCVLNRTDGTADVLTITINNAYPTVHYYCDFDVHSSGTIPVRLDLGGPGALPTGTTVEILPDPTLANTATGSPAHDPDVVEGLQLHQSNVAYGRIHVHLQNTHAQGTEGNFTFQYTIVLEQWNEYAP